MIDQLLTQRLETIKSNISTSNQPELESLVILAMTSFGTTEQESDLLSNLLLKIDAGTTSEREILRGLILVIGAKMNRLLKVTT